MVSPEVQAGSSKKDVTTYELYVIPIKQSFYRRFLSQKFLITSETQPFGTAVITFRSIDFHATNGDIFSLKVRWERLRPNFQLFKQGNKNPVAHTDPTIKSTRQFILIDEEKGSKGVLRAAGISPSLWGLEGETESMVAQFSRHHRLFPKSVSEKRLSSITSFEKVASRQIDSVAEPTQLPLLSIFAQMILFSLESHGA
jgi:hypothetical protein